MGLFSFLASAYCDAIDLLRGEHVEWGRCDWALKQEAETYDPCHPVYGDPTSEECKKAETGLPPEGLWGLQNELTVVGAIILGAIVYRVVK